VILVGDCGQDVPMRFDDLADTMRKCYTDFGVCIEIDVGECAHSASKGEERFSEKSVIIGKIHYPAQAGAAAFTGHLILVKPTLSKMIYSDAPDVRNYALINAEFPQQSTVDQFFDEAQFESYRKLGLLIGRNVLAAKGEDGTSVRTLLSR
jgi:hypothetical protein